jgi:V/A-type H+-transporting ATPase subunit E
MGYQELIEALRSEGEEKIRAIRQEAEAEAEALRTKAAGEIERIRAEHDRQQSKAVADLSGEALAEAAARAREIRLRAEQELSGRMARLARASLAQLRDDRYAETFAGLVRELPQHPWMVARVNPADVDMAKTHFPGAEIVPDITIIGGLEVSDRGERIRVVNTFEKRLERSWPEILPGLVRELEKDLETEHDDRQQDQR